MTRFCWHDNDSDCRVDSITQCCVQCGADHSQRCPSCDGRAFHKEGCAELE